MPLGNTSLTLTATQEEVRDELALPKSRLPAQGSGSPPAALLPAPGCPLSREGAFCHWAEAQATGSSSAQSSNFSLEYLVRSGDILGCHQWELLLALGAHRTVLPPHRSPGSQTSGVCFPHGARDPALAHLKAFSSLGQLERQRLVTGPQSSPAAGPGWRHSGATSESPRCSELRFPSINGP